MPITTSVSSTDESNYDTLKNVLGILTNALIGLDKWSAFDSEEKELKLKQQIVAHRIAYGVLSEAHELVRNTVTTIDENYKAKQEGQA